MCGVVKLFGLMEIHVIRHTPVDTPAPLCYGQLEVPLAASFEADAQQYAAELDADYAVVYSSPATRCVALGEALGHTALHQDQRLLELDFGAWEGQTWEAIPSDALDRWMRDFVHERPTGGESFEEMAQRVHAFMDELRTQSHNKVLLITHAGVIRCLWAYLLQIPLNQVFKIPVGFHEVLVFKMGAVRDYDALVRLC